MKRFQKGDLVHVNKNKPGRMRSAELADVDAIVVGSYYDTFGWGSKRSYTLYIKGHGEVSWYEDYELTLLESNRSDLLGAWENEQDNLATIHSSIDWIFANADTMLTNTPVVSVSTLAAHLGCDNLWGSRGEGIDHYANMFRVMSLALPYIRNGDKDGWLVFSQGVKASGAFG